MKNAIFTTIILVISIFPNTLFAQKNSWKKVNKVQTTIENITYTFPAEVNKQNRQKLIQLCEKSIKENLEILKETEFTNKMDIEFLNSRHEMQKYAGFPSQGRAVFQSNAMFSLMTKNSPIKHEMMHMIAYYKWGDSADYWIDEGFATYSGGTCSNYSLQEIYQYYIQSGKLIPYISLMSDDFVKYNDMISYTQSAFIIEYLLRNYEIDKFKSLWKEGAINFSKIYGFSLEVLENRISADLKIKYPKNIDFNWEEFDKGCQ